MKTPPKADEVVDKCIERLSHDVPLEKLGPVLAQLVGALWFRSSRTLSEVTLSAIFERALFLSKDKFPFLASFKIDHNNPLSAAFDKSREADNQQLVNGFRYFLIEIINLVGNLTSNILLTGLYQELQTFLLRPVAVAELSLQDKGTENSKNLNEREDRSDSISRVLTHVSNLDEILGGGLLKGTITIVAGAPGTGKTILSQQICIANATPDRPVLFFQTLSEPTAKTLKYLRQFKFYDPAKIADGSVEFVDLAGILKINGVQEGINLIMDHVKRVQPAFVVIDSFKVFEELANSREELRKFSYEVAVNLMAWECTTLLLGEFNKEDLETNPLVSIVDGLIRLSVRAESGEQQRFIQVIKMRGTDHSRDEHTLAITADGVGVYAPRVTIRREHDEEIARNKAGSVRARLGISRIDELLGEGVPVGSSFLISGVAGTGKTLLSLEFLYRGAVEFGQKGIYFSFEETEERLRAEARAMGWEMDKLIESGMIEMIFIAQPDIVVEKHLLMMSDKITNMQAKRIVIDSVSLFVHKVTDQQIVREKIFQLATLVQKTQGIGFFITDIPYGSSKLSRFGVEETVVDGVILLTSSEKEFSRERFIEIYKLRNTAHLDGRHKMEITSDGIFITPRQIDRHHQARRETKSEAGANYVTEPTGNAIGSEEVLPARDPVRYQ